MLRKFVCCVSIVTSVAGSVAGCSGPPASAAGFLMDLGPVEAPSSSEERDPRVLARVPTREGYFMPGTFAVRGDEVVIAVEHTVHNGQFLCASQCTEDELEVLRGTLPAGDGEDDEEMELESIFTTSTEPVDVWTPLVATSDGFLMATNDNLWTIIDGRVEDTGAPGAEALVGGPDGRVLATGIFTADDLVARVIDERGATITTLEFDAFESAVALPRGWMVDGRSGEELALHLIDADGRVEGTVDVGGADHLAFAATERPTIASRGGEVLRAPMLLDAVRLERFDTEGARVSSVEVPVISGLVDELDDGDALRRDVLGFLPAGDTALFVLSGEYRFNHQENGPAELLLIWIDVATGEERARREVPVSLRAGELVSVREVEGRILAFVGGMPLE